MTTPACNCARPAGEAHFETCAWVKWLRSRPNDDDLEIPEFLRRRKAPAVPSGGVFD